MSDLDAYFEMLHTDRRMAEWVESERNEQEWWEWLTPIERWILEDRARDRCVSLQSSVLAPGKRCGD
jgi:hypothetical protein